MNLTILLLVGIIFVIIYGLYLFLRTTALTKGVVLINANVEEIVAEKLEYMGRDIYYDGWLFIMKGPASGGAFIEREIKIGINDTKFIIQTKKGNTWTDHIITTDFPLQKWVYFAVRYKDNVLEVYLNGKLIKTIYTSSNVIINTSKDEKLKIGNTNVSGYLTKLRRLVTPPDSNKIWEYYLEGNGQFSGVIGSILNYFDNYDAVIKVYQNDIKQREQKLF